MSESTTHIQTQNSDFKGSARGGRGATKDRNGSGQGRGRGRGRGRGQSTSGGGRQKNTHHNSSSDSSNPIKNTQSNILSTNENDNNNEEDVEAMEHHHCLVCYSPTVHKSRGITPCNHDTICASCHLRIRSLHNDKRCPICKTTNDSIIIDSDPNPNVNQYKKFEEYEKWGNDLGPNFVYREDVQMFFPVEYYYKQVVPLFSLQCNVRNCNYGKDQNIKNKNNITLKGLNHHLAAAHSMSLCQLCVENKRDFISKLPRFTQNQLKEHNKHGDNHSSNNNSNNTSSNKGHPLCQFCSPKRFYDLTALHEHLNKEHYKCHVCEKLGIHNQFFRDYHKLSMHFEKEHYLCHHPDCLAARFIVFQNDIDLATHERDVHNIYTRGGSRKINLGFNYVREDDVTNSNQTVPDLEDDFNYGVNGEVFVPDSLQENEPEITHGPHAERTAMIREQARKRREELGLNGEENQEDEVEAFPTLSATASGVSAMGWATGSATAATALRGRNTTALTEENFPSLGPSSRPQSSISNKLKVSRKGPTLSNSLASSFSAVSRNSTPSYGVTTYHTTQRNYTANVSSMNSKANLSSDNFPSLGGSNTSRTTSTNKYAEAQAYAKKNLTSANFPSLGVHNNNSKQSSTKKKTSTIFEAKRPPALDNILDFPSAPLSSSTINGSLDGKVQVEKMKSVLGQAKYKELKKLTKSFAANDIDPESYVSSSISLFDRGIEDQNFWDTVPSLIDSCPNISSSKRAKRYLDSLRYPMTLQEQANSISGNNGQNGGWSDHVNSIQASFQTSQTKKNAWGSSNVKPATKLGSSVIAAASQAPKLGTATKFMVKEKTEQKKLKKIESEAQQGTSGKKKKATAKKNELRDLAFGKFS